MRSMAIGALVSVVFVLASVPAPAQPPTRRRYVPRRPTMSPYLDYFRRDTGLLDPYNLFRSRDIRQNQLYQQQQRQIYQQQQELYQQRLQFQELQGAQRQMRASGASQTGHGSTFMNYSHYFGGVSGAGPTAGRASPRR